MSRWWSCTSGLTGRSRSPGTCAPSRVVPRLDDGHFPPAPAGALHRQPAAKSAAEAEFLALGQGARLWLTEAAAAGATRMRVKMAEAVALGKLFGATRVDWALGHAAVHGRFAEADLPSILDHHRAPPRAPGRAGLRGQRARRSLTQGTAAWAALGATDGAVTVTGLPAGRGHPTTQAVAT